jgi:branched-chain amino acid transport system substrate-binding protein
LSFEGLIAPVKLSCADHEGASKVRIQQWDGKKWAFISEWLTPDQKLIRPMVEESAAKYAKEKNITPTHLRKGELIELNLGLPRRLRRHCLQSTTSR